MRASEFVERRQEEQLQDRCPAVAACSEGGPADPPTLRPASGPAEQLVDQRADATPELPRERGRRRLVGNGIGSESERRSRSSRVSEATCARNIRTAPALSPNARSISSGAGGGCRSGPGRRAPVDLGSPGVAVVDVRGGAVVPRRRGTGRSISAASYRARSSGRLSQSCATLMRFAISSERAPATSGWCCFQQRPPGTVDRRGIGIMRDAEAGRTGRRRGSGRTSSDGRGRVVAGVCGELRSRINRLARTRRNAPSGQLFSVRARATAAQPHRRR